MFIWTDFLKILPIFNIKFFFAEIPFFKTKFWAPEVPSPDSAAKAVFMADKKTIDKKENHMCQLGERQQDKH